MWMKQEFKKGSFLIDYLPTSEMPADGLTKNLSRQRFEHFRAMLNLQNVQHLIKNDDMGPVDLQTPQEASPLSFVNIT